MQVAFSCRWVSIFTNINRSHILPKVGFFFFLYLALALQQRHWVIISHHSLGHLWKLLVWGPSL